MNLFEKSAIFLHGKLSQAASRRVLYVRVKGSEQWNLTIPVSQRQYIALDEQDHQTFVTSYDWVILASTLPVIPRRGDEIIDLDARQTYTVVPLRPRPACEGFDSQGISHLVHSKLTEVENE